MSRSINSRRGSKFARYLAYCAVALIAIVVTAAFILPEFLDSPAVRAEIQRKLSETAQGEIAWDDLSIRILPSPRGVLRQARIEISGMVSVRAEQIDARLLFWPLLRGRAEIVAVSVARPEIRIDIAPSPSGAGELDPFAAYRSILQPIVDIVREFAPDTALTVEDAVVDVRVSGVPPIELRDLSLRLNTGSRGMDLEATTAGNYWDRMKLSARVEYADLSGKLSLDARDIRPQAWFDLYFEKSPVRVALPAANLRAQARTDAKTSLECDFDVGAGVVEVLHARERIRVAGAGVKGKVTAGLQEIALGLDDVRLGAGRLHGVKLRYDTKSGALAGGAGFDLDLKQGMDATRHLVPGSVSVALARFQDVSGRAHGRVRLASGRSGWRVGVDVLKSDAAVGLRDLPGPVRLAGGQIDVDSSNLKITRAALSMLDAQALVSATVSDYRTEQLQATGSLSEGMVGEQLLAWVWQLAKVPPHLELKAPVRIAAQRIAWSAKRILDVAATASFGAGPEVAVELGWTPETLDIRRAAIKDLRSDAAIALRTEGHLLEGKFSGTMDSTSITAMLRSATVPSGAVAGDLRFVVDRENPSRTTAEGNLKGEALDLAWLLRRPVKIDRIDLAADGSSLHIDEASMNWAGQRATIRGEVKRGTGGPVIDARFDSTGINLDVLLPPWDKTAKAETPAVGRDLKRPLEEKGELSWLWPLPVTGRIVARSDFVHYGRYKVAPVAATLVLESQRAHLDLSQAQLCGISLPLTIEANPRTFAATTRIVAKQQQLEQAAHCLTDKGVLISGDFDLQADLGTEGKAGELRRNLKGTVRADVRDGKVMKFALLGNILSMTNIAALLDKEGPKLDNTGFPYRSLTVSGHFQGGRFIVEESAFNSDAVGLAAKGWISILDYQSQLSVLVAPFSRIDQLARKVPILGYILGGALTSVPVGVSGDIRDPRVVPLGPGAITSELVGIFERTLKLPGKLILPLEGK